MLESLEEGGDAASGARLLLGGTDVGCVTQAVESPFLGSRTLGLAQVDKDATAPGTRVVARVGDGEVAGEIVEHPVYEKGRRKAKEL